jgi:hypothetical protein
MPFDDLLADGQADAGARVVRTCVESLEQNEDALQVPWLDANTVITHAKCPWSVLLQRGRDMHTRCFVWTVERDAICEQVLKQLAELSRVTLYDRQVVAGDAGIRILDCGGQVTHHLINQLHGVNCLQLKRLCARARVGEQMHRLLRNQ